MAFWRSDRGGDVDADRAALRRQFEDFVGQARPAGGAVAPVSEAAPVSVPTVAQPDELRRELVAARAEAASTRRELVAARAVNEHLADEVETLRRDLEATGARLSPAAGAPTAPADLLR